MAASVCHHPKCPPCHHLKCLPHCCQECCIVRAVYKSIICPQLHSAPNFLLILLWMLGRAPDLGRENSTFCCCHLVRVPNEYHKYHCQSWHPSQHETSCFSTLKGEEYKKASNFVQFFEPNQCQWMTYTLQVERCSMSHKQLRHPINTKELLVQEMLITHSTF